MKKILSIFMTAAMILSLMCVSVMADEEKFATVDALQFAKDKEPTVDGVISAAEWGTPTVSNINKDNGQTFVKTAGSDMEFTLWTRYNFTGFYVAAVTADNEHWNGNVLANPNDIWNGDCLQIRLDAYGCTVDQGLVPNGSNRDGNWHTSYNEFAFALGNDGNTYSYSWHGVVDHEDLSGGNGRYVVKHDASKKETTYELFIPWDVILQAPPHVGTELGFSVGILNGDAATGGYNNYIEWGTGIFNGRLTNVYGSNRLVFNETRATGGDALVDPNPDITVRPVENVTADAFLIDFNEYVISSSEGMTTTLNDDGSLHMALTGEDPKVIFNIDSSYAINAEDYQYVALYLKTNERDYGELFFKTNAAPEFDAGLSVMTEYFDVEGGQIIVVDFKYFLGYEWNGRVLDLRFDPVNTVTDTLTSEMTLYGLGFFKNYADACQFNIEGVTVETDPGAYVDPGQTEAEDETDAPAEDTEAPASESAAADTADGTQATGTDAEEDGGSSNKGLIIAIVAVVVVAVGAVGVILAKKKKA